MDAQGNLIRRLNTPPERIDYRLLLRWTVIGCLTVLIDRERIGPVHMLDLPQHEDLTLWYSILKRGFVAHGIQEDLARYRIVPGSASGHALRSARRMWNVYRKIEQLPLGEAAACFVRYAVHAGIKRLD
jgi:teichuronic acid biosynthesis glycosyltransferase TuaG